MAVENTVLEGLGDVLKNLNEEIAKIENATLDGLLEAGLYIKAQAGKVVPVEYGNLKGSCYVITSGGGSPDETVYEFKGPYAEELTEQHATEINSAIALLEEADHPIVEIGYTAYYAVYVHEDEEKSHKPGKQAKFLQNAMADNQKMILKIIQQRAEKS